LPASTPKPVSAALFSADILDFLALLRKYAVRYVIVGGEAAVQYGHARLTADMDIFYDAAPANTLRFPNRGRSLQVHFIGLEELIRHKKSAGRNRNLDDLRFLLEARRRLKRRLPGPRPER
jgi:hypothetical protein